MTTNTNFKVKRGLEVGGDTTLAGANNAVGTVTSGVWNGTPVGAKYGGTGADLTAMSGILRVTNGTLSTDGNVVLKNAGGTITAAAPTNLNEVATAQFFYDNNFLNFEPKVGKGNDPYVVVSSNFKASWIESVGVIIQNEYDQECCYFVASDGKSQRDMFKAYKITTESTWSFAPDPVRPYFLTSTEYITEVYTGDEEYLFVNVYDTSSAANRQVLIKTNGRDSTMEWTRVDLPTPAVLSGYAKFYLGQDRIVDVYPSGTTFRMSVFKLSNMTQVGATRTIFDYIADIDYSHPTAVMTSRSVRYFSPFYNPATNNLIVYFGIIGYYTNNGTTAYAIPGFTLSYDMPSTVIESDTGTPTPLIPYSSFVFHSTGNLYDNSAVFRYSYNKPSNTLYIQWKNFWTSATIGWSKKTVTGQFTSRADFVPASSSLSSPDSSPWSKYINLVFLLPNNICIFYGNSTLYGTRHIVAEYTVTGNTMSIVPGRWRMFNAKPVTAPSSVLDNAVPSNLQDFSNHSKICVTFDTDNSPLVLYSAGPGNAIYKVTVDPTTLIINFTPYSAVSTVPALPVGYTSAGNNWGYDPKRSIFYFTVRKTGEFNSHRVLAYAGGSWYESPFINETEANVSRNSIYGTTVGVNASVSSGSNILIDQSGDLYVNQSYGVVGGALSAPYNRLTFDGTTFVVERGNTSVTANTGTYGISYGTQGFAARRTYTNDIRTYTLTSDLSARTALITGPNSNLNMWVSGSAGLIAFIAAQDIFVAGHWTKLTPTSVNLLPNATNYIYVRRKTDDVRVLEAFVSTTKLPNTFSKILIASVVTDAANPVSQVNYTVNETTAQWSNISGRPTLKLSGDVAGSVSLVSSTPVIATSLTATGVTAGTYKSVTVDAKGRVTSGTNPTTLAGYGITDAVSSSLIGAASGIVPLGSDSKIAATYLPSYVDDIVEYANLATFPATGETGKIYVAQDTNKIYRWSGSTYIEISPTGIDITGNAATATTAGSVTTTNWTFSQDTDGSLVFKYDGVVKARLASDGTFKSINVDSVPTP